MSNEPRPVPRYVAAAATYSWDAPIQPDEQVARCSHCAAEIVYRCRPCYKCNGTGTLEIRQAQVWPGAPATAEHADALVMVCNVCQGRRASVARVNTVGGAHLGTCTGPDERMTQ